MRRTIFLRIASQLPLFVIATGAPEGTDRDDKSEELGGTQSDSALGPADRRTVSSKAGGAATQAKLYGVAGSHNVAIAEAMLRYKGIEYVRRDLPLGVHRLGLLRLLRFRGSTVPALGINGRRFLGTRAISRGIDSLQAEPPLFPADQGARRAVAEAERFGEEIMQQVPRRVFWAAARRDPASLQSFSADARPQLPNALAKALLAPLAALMSRLNGATDAAAYAELSRLPTALAHIERLLDDRVIGGSPPNAADFQLAAQIRVLMCLDDIRPTVERHRGAALALALYPNHPGRIRSVFSASERALLERDGRLHSHA